MFERRRHNPGTHPRGPLPFRLPFRLVTDPVPALPPSRRPPRSSRVLLASTGYPTDRPCVPGPPCVYSPSMPIPGPSPASGPASAPTIRASSPGSAAPARRHCRARRFPVPRPARPPLRCACPPPARPRQPASRSPARSRRSVRARPATAAPRPPGTAEPPVAPRRVTAATRTVREDWRCVGPVTVATPVLSPSPARVVLGAEGGAGGAPPAVATPAWGRPAAGRHSGRRTPHGQPSGSGRGA